VSCGAAQANRTRQAIRPPALNLPSVGSYGGPVACKGYSPNLQWWEKFERPSQRLARLTVSRRVAAQERMRQRIVKSYAACDGRTSEESGAALRLESAGDLRGFRRGYALPLLHLRTSAFVLRGASNQTITMATQESSGSGLIGAVVHDRIRPIGGVRIEARDGPAVAETWATPAQTQTAPLTKQGPRRRQDRLVTWLPLRYRGEPKQQCRHRGCRGDEAEALADCSPERPLARRRLAPRRRGVALGRQRDSQLGAGDKTNAIVRAARAPRSELAEARRRRLRRTRPDRQVRSRRVVSARGPLTPRAVRSARLLLRWTSRHATGRPCAHA